MKLKHKEEWLPWVRGNEMGLGGVDRGLQLVIIYFSS